MGKTWLVNVSDTVCIPSFLSKHQLLSSAFLKKLIESSQLHYRMLYLRRRAISDISFRFKISSEVLFLCQNFQTYDNLIRRYWKMKIFHFSKIVLRRNVFLLPLHGTINLVFVP